MQGLFLQERKGVKKSEIALLKRMELAVRVLWALVEKKGRREWVLKRSPSAMGGYAAPGRFCGKCAELIEKEGDAESRGSKCAQAYRQKRLREFSGGREGSGVPQDLQEAAC
jgi:hypothetical protein